MLVDPADTSPAEADTDRDPTGMLHALWLHVKLRATSARGVAVVASAVGVPAERVLQQLKTWDAERRELTNMPRAEHDWTSAVYIQRVSTHTEAYPRIGRISHKQTTLAEIPRGGNCHREEALASDHDVNDGW